MSEKVIKLSIKPITNCKECYWYKEIWDKELWKLKRICQKENKEIPLKKRWSRKKL